jgi:transposase
MYRFYKKSHLLLIPSMAKKVFTLMSKNEKFIKDAVLTINYLCPIKKCPATKYSNEDYLRGILEVFYKYSCWRSYEGKIKWKTLNAKYNQWCKLNVFDTIHEQLLTKYLKKNKTKKLKYQSIDSTAIANKQGCKLVEYNGFYGRKRYIKVSSLTDVDGVPLAIHVFSGKGNDNDTIKNTMDALPIDLDTKKHQNNNRYKQYLLADTGYCSEANRSLLTKKGYTPLIWHNRRNTKDKTKLKKFNNKQLLKYKNRRIIEPQFAWLKRFPKVNCLYEKNISSFYGFVLLAACHRISNKI